jgi:hypothetical protein
VLMARMQDLLADQAEARRLGANAGAVARRRFGLDRFRRDWNAAFARAIELRSAAGRNGHLADRPAAVAVPTTPFSVAPSLPNRGNR